MIIQELALENERKKLAEDRLAILEHQMKIEKEKQKEKKKQEKKVKQEQMKILGKDKSRPKLSFSLIKNWLYLISQIKRLFVIIDLNFVYVFCILQINQRGSLVVLRSKGKKKWFIMVSSQDKAVIQVTHFDFDHFIIK